MFFLVSPAVFPTSVRLIRGGYCGAAPRAAGTGSVKYVLLSRSGSIAPLEQVLDNAHSLAKYYGFFPVSPTVNRPELIRNDNNRIQLPKCIWMLISIYAGSLSCILKSGVPVGDKSNAYLKGLRAYKWERGWKLNFSSSFYRGEYGYGWHLYLSFYLSVYQRNEIFSRDFLVGYLYLGVEIFDSFSFGYAFV